MKHKILFVYDQSTTLLIEQMLFSRRGDYSLIAARDSKEAIQIALAEHPNLILMDRTPANLEACREMQKNEKLQRIPVLMVTSAADSSCENGASSGYSEDPSQSLNWHGLLEMVNTYLAARGVNLPR
ncbi:MAG TPA: hypothetical protein VKH81_25410 [Candidatus Angelobacter sp.]|nr:hypothetical protein [Candidatus Angelobacter sp.]